MPEPCFDVSGGDSLGDRKPIEGSELVLECAVRHRSSYTVLWSHNGRVVAINDKVISPAESKMRVAVSARADVFNLVLDDVDVSKNGTFECSVVSRTYPTLAYRVEVLVPPRVARLPADADIVMDEGGAQLVQCLATGNPKPELTYSRQGEKGMHTAVNIVSSTMELTNVDPSYAGIYYCTATNGVGAPATSEFNIFVRCTIFDAAFYIIN